MRSTGERLAQSLKDNGLTMARFAVQCGVTRSAVHKWRYDVNPLRVDRLRQVARALSVDPDWLAYGVTRDRRTTLLAIVDAVLVGDTPEGEIAFICDRLNGAA